MSCRYARTCESHLCKEKYWMDFEAAIDPKCFWDIASFLSLNLSTAEREGSLLGILPHKPATSLMTGPTFLEATF